MSAATDQFPRDTSGLRAAAPAEIVELFGGQRFELFSFDVAAVREPSV